MATRPFTGPLAPYGEGDIKRAAAGMKALTFPWRSIGPEVRVGDYVFREWRRGSEGGQTSGRPSGGGGDLRLVRMSRNKDDHLQEFLTFSKPQSNSAA
jgi:hypothetical protein